MINTKLKDIPKNKPIELKSLSGKNFRILLKQEWSDPAGDDPIRSIKRKPAYLVFEDALERGYLDGNKIIISATSGNFGIEIGMLATQHDIPFLAVAPAAISEYNLALIRSLGISVLKTEEQETCPREYTVFFARGYSHEFHHRLVNIEQYYSFLNPMSHALTTGPEIFEDVPDARAIVLSVGSCGTISGIAQYVLATGRDVKLIGVQPELHHGIPGTHIIKGDCKWNPENYSPVILQNGGIVSADTVDSYAFTIYLWKLGIEAGPSTGMALSRAFRMAKSGAEGDIVVISPDNTFKYGDLISAKLSALRGEIVARYPELELGDAIDKFVAKQAGSGGLEPLVARLKKIYNGNVEGKLLNVSNIEDIVTGEIEIPINAAKATV